MNRIKNYEISVLLFFLTQSQLFIYGLNSFTKESGRATIIAMILGSIIGFFLLKLTLSKKYFTLKKKSLFLLIPFLVLHLSYILNQTIHFITYNVVSTISYYLLAAAFLLLVVFCVKRGLKTITRSAFIYLITSIFLFCITFLLLFPKMDFSNVLPLMDSSTFEIGKSLFIYLLISISPYFYLSIFERKLDKEGEKRIVRGYILTHIFLIFNTLIIFSILGLELINLYPYPEISIFKKVSFLNVIDRMETIFSLTYFLALFLQFAIGFYALHFLMRRILPIKKEEVSLLLLATILFFFSASFSLSRNIWLVTLGLHLLFYLFTSKSVIH